MRIEIKKTLFGLIVLVMALGLSSCATKMIAKPPSEYLYTTRMSTSMLFAEMTAELDELKYRVRKKDVSAGIFLTQPLKFKFKSKGTAVQGEQVVQIRQEGGSIKLRIVYRCEYAGGKSAGACYVNDSDTANRISILERRLLEALEPVFERTRPLSGSRQNVDITTGDEKSDEGEFEENWDK